jgi:hypothetical protein
MSTTNMLNGLPGEIHFLNHYKLIDKRIQIKKIFSNTIIKYSFGFLISKNEYFPLKETNIAFPHSMLGTTTKSIFFCPTIV